MNLKGRNIQVDRTLACSETPSVHKGFHRERDICWLDLPEHVVFLVAENLTRKTDLVRFGSVCRTWQSISMDVQRRRSPRLPLLMLSTEDNADNQTRSFYNLTHKTVCNTKIQVPRNTHCPGSSHGWLITVSSDFQIRLLNLFSSNNDEIHLPSLKTFPYNERINGSQLRVGFIRKAVLSANPALEPNYVVFAIYDARRIVGFCKPGDKAWTSLDTPFGGITDVIYYRDQFHFVATRGEVYACDLDCPDPKISTVAPRTPPPKYDNRRYLVESPSGDLLQIIRFTDFDDFTYFNEGFAVFKLDPTEHKWIELENIDGLVLFLGDNTSLCLPASDFPECKPNSVYFTDDDIECYKTDARGPHDMGVFSFEDGTTTPHYTTKSNMIYPAPIWIEPPTRA